MFFCDNLMWTLFTFLLGVVTGVGLVAAGVWYMLSFFFHDPDNKKDSEGFIQPKEPTSATFQLPPVLITKISDESCKSKESCWALNFVLYFLFRELRNSEGIRRWMLRKLSLEFEELLTTSVLGKFFSSISIQNVDLGQNFPVVNWLKTSKVELHPVFKNISTLDILVDLDYAGGFQFAIQAETHLKHSAFLSVQFNGVKGQARLQFNTEPYAHWSFSFAENPDIDISVVSQLYGKSFSHITSIISSQLKRSVRKKHTLPMYKIRYKPFFNRVEPIIAALVPNSSPRADIKGSLLLTVIECRGLMSSLLHGNIYSTLAIGDFDWVASYTDINSNHVFIVRDLVYVKTARRETNLDFTLGLVNDTPTVESLTPMAALAAGAGAPHSRQYLEFEIGDEVLAVDGKKVNSIKQCIKNFKNSSSMKVIWRIRRKFSTIVLPTLEEMAVEEAPSEIKELSEPVQPKGDGKGSVGTSFPVVVKDGENSKIENDLLLTTPSNVVNNGGSKSTTPSHSRKNSFAEITAAVAEAAFNSNESCTSENTTAEIDGSGAGKERKMSYGFRQSYHDARHCHVVRTADTPCCRDPIFTESFSLGVEESNRFLNLALWSAKITGVPDNSAPSSPTSSPSKRSKSSIANLEAITFGSDRLIGTLSIPIADVIAECSTTGMGYFVKDYYLRSPDGNSAEAKENPLIIYSGFEPHMCYGKISLSFLFKSDEENSKRKDSIESTSSSPTGHGIELAAEALLEQNNLSPSEEFQTHQFVRTHFRSATICDYCNKKIWLKEAFACRICNMKCHKKCNERCMANTICRGEGFYPSVQNFRGVHPSTTPEIITTEPMNDSNDVSIQDDLNSDNGSFCSSNSRSLQPTQPNGAMRRKTLGGLIVSAVQNRSAQLQLRRAGSATNLLPPNLNSSTTTRSLPPSPKASPSMSRKTSGSPSGEMFAINPFELLSAGGFGSSEDDLNAAVEHLMQHPNDDLVSLAKESGRDVYSDLSLAERKQKLNRTLNRLQEEIDLMSNKRMELSKEELLLCPAARSAISQQIGKYEEKVQALALLMLYFCSGLQQVQDLEEVEKEEQLLIQISHAAATTDDDSSDALEINHE